MMWLLWLSIVGVAVAWAVVLTVRHCGDNEYLDGADIDEGALEGDLTRYVAEQNEAGR